MKVLRLDIVGLRCIDQLSLRSGDGVQFLLGANGAGKTTILEAMHLLGYGRSFRAGARDAVIRRGAVEATVFAEIESGTRGRHRVGLRRGAAEWSARLDDSDVGSLLELFRVCPVVCFEPGSHALIAGASELRRGYLDWSVFHVEPDFLPAWRRHQRALRQRNAGLKAGWDDDALEPWELELAMASQVVARCRRQVIADLATAVVLKASAFLPELGVPELRLSSGFGDRPVDSIEDLVRAYADSRAGDRERGHTRFGAQRADWTLAFEGAPRREHLSRGQEKLAALVMELAQVQHFREQVGEWPLLLLDDLASELDLEHQARVLDWVFATGVQAWLTGTFVPEALQQRARDWTLFHVERGRVTSA
jgi:DNA replication and repair protein RecF